VLVTRPHAKHRLSKRTTPRTASPPFLASSQSALRFSGAYEVIYWYRKARFQTPSLVHSQWLSEPEVERKVKHVKCPPEIIWHHWISTIYRGSSFSFRIWRSFCAAPSKPHAAATIQPVTNYSLAGQQRHTNTRPKLSRQSGSNYIRAPRVRYKQRREGVLPLFFLHPTTFNPSGCATSIHQLTFSFSLKTLVYNL
jgi:hypothetical protein